ncbi:ATP-dependent RNA helicase Rok1p [Diutina catenulata]
MDIFRILSRGASIKKSKKASADFALPTAAQEASMAKKEENLQTQVDRELDFFHTKKHKPEPEQKAEEEPEEEEEVAPLTVATPHDAERLRAVQQIRVTGEDVPHPIGSFADLTGRYSFDKRVLRNLTDNGFAEPTPIQCQGIPLAMDGRDIIGCAPTGSGKTLAFAIPLIQRLLDEEITEKNHGVRALIISPTSELAAQIADQLELLTRGKTQQITVGHITKKIAGRINAGAINSAKYDVLVSTPLRLIELVKHEKVSLSLVTELVVDEADKLFSRGFVEQTDEILSHCTNPRIRKSMFSATMLSGVEDMARSIMRDPIRVVVGKKEAASSTIDQKLVFTGNEEGKLLAIRQMIQNSEFKPPVIIFLQSIHRAKALFHELLYDRLNVDVIHAERTPKQREEVIKRFKQGDIWVLITTDVLSRGVDFKGVNLVINYDVPQSAQVYVHRIGRTGRGGKAGRAVTFFTKDDNLAIKPIINAMKQSGCEQGYSEWMSHMNKLTQQEQKRVKRKVIDRKEISTVPKVVKRKRKQRDEMVAASKKRKQSGLGPREKRPREDDSDSE